MDKYRKKQPRKKTFKSFQAYCRYVLLNSGLTGLSPIIKSKGCFYKSVRIFILAFSVAGFLFQTFQFLQLYWEFATVESVRDMDTMVKPAITICDQNIIRRMYVCLERSEMCEWKEDIPFYYDFCDNYPIYCEDEDDVWPLVFEMEDYPDDFYDLNFTKEYGFQIEDGLHSCMWYSEDEPDKKNRSSYSACGKPKYVRGINRERIPTSCYVLYSHTGEENYTEEVFYSDTMLMLNLKWIVNDNISPYNSRNYYVSFHHPGAISNPYDEGFLVEEGRLYKIQIHQENTVRLKSPYATDCFDYYSAWAKNKGYGPLRRHECHEQCEMKLQLENYGCVLKEISYPHEEKICTISPPFSLKLNSAVRECFEHCKEACLEIKYALKKEILTKMTREEALRKYGSRSAVSLQIQFNVLDSTIYLHRPKYETVEVFSYIGGYLGMWLGWSLMVILDFFGTIVNLCKYPFMVKNRQKKLKIVRTFNIDKYYYS